MGNHGATLRPPPTPPPTPNRPEGHGDAGPPPLPRKRGPPPPCRTAVSGRGAAAGPASTPPAACSRMNCDGQANPRQRTRAPADRAQGQQASTNQSGMGATPSMARATPKTHALLPAQGRQRDGPRQGDPPPHWPPLSHRWGERRAGCPPPLPRPPAQERPESAALGR